MKPTFEMDTITYSTCWYYWVELEQVLLEVSIRDWDNYKRVIRDHNQIRLCDKIVLQFSDE